MLEIGGLIAKARGCHERRSLGRPCETKHTDQVRKTTVLFKVDSQCEMRKDSNKVQEMPRECLVLIFRWRDVALPEF